LQSALGATYEVHYPQMPDEDAPDFGWGRKIGQEIAALQGEVILVGHSLGASMLLKYLSENAVNRKIGGIFLISTPFWGRDESWQESLSLQENFAEKLPEGVPIFLYHSRDDEEVDFAHLRMYAKKLPQATLREVTSGGHQLGNDLTQVAQDIQDISIKTKDSHGE
jgi:uncharacterized protein